MPTAINWTEAVQPNYVALLPEFIVVGLMLAIMILDFYVKEKRVLVWSTVAGLALAALATWYAATDEGIAKAIASGRPIEAFGGMVIADHFGFYLKGVLLVVAALITMLSMDFVEKYMTKMFLEFYEIILAATLGMMFMVGSQDLLMIYLGLELSSISSYVLAGLLRKDPKSNEAALKYFLNGAVASAVLLFGFSLVYGVTGETYLPQMAKVLGAWVQTGNPGMLSLLVTGVIFMVGGFAFKVAAVPMHLWAPDVYEGSPTPITGFFSVGPKGAAFGAILRIFLIGFSVTELASEWSLIWAVLAVASMFLGNLTALMQSNIKRMMAYSSIAQAGYILTGVVAASKTPLGGSAVLYYVLAYAITNVGIFAVLTHMDQEGGWVSIDDFKGLSTRNPLYAWSLLIAFVSLIGIPPTVGFFGKFFLFNAALKGGYLWLALSMAVNSAISVGYYYGVVKAMFLEKSDKAPLPTSVGVMATVVVSLVGVIVIGLWSGPFVELTRSAIALIR